MDFLGRSEQELTNPFNPFDEIVLENSVRRNKHESELKLQKKMKKNCEKWEAKCSELKLKLKDMKHMKNAACNKQDTLRAENKNLIEAYEIIREANEKIIAENEQFRQHNKSMQVKVEKKLRICTDYKGMQNRYASISIENDRLHERIENLKREKCYDGNVELLNDNRHLKNVNKHMKKELLICAEKIAEVTKLVRSHRKNSKKWHQFQEKSECAKKKFFDVYDDVCMENENLLQINDALRSHNECIENALKTMREKFEKFADYDDIHDQHTIVANENVRLRHEIENMKKEMREVREERNEQSAKRKHIRNENGKILSEYDRIETDHAELLEENAILRQVNQDILKELEHAREKHQCVTKKCNDLKALNQKDNGSSDAVSAGGVNPCKDDRSDGYPLRIRFDSVKFIGQEEAKISFSLIDYELISVTILNYDIFVSYEVTSNGEVIDQSKHVECIPGNNNRSKITVVVSLPPKQLSDKIKCGVRPTYESNILGPVYWSDVIN